MEESTCSILEHMGNDGKQLYTTKYYNLDAIISVGFRVNTKKGIEFRQWANGVLKQYLLKGYAVNQRMFDIEQKMAEQGLHRRDYSHHAQQTRSKCICHHLHTPALPTAATRHPTS